MNIHSRKAKGRRLQQKIRDILLEKTHKFGLVEGDIQSNVMNNSGRDIVLSPVAEKVIPFDIECKNTERLNIWSAIEQAEKNTKQDRDPLVIISKNRTEIYAVIKLEKLLDLLYPES